MPLDITPTGIGTCEITFTEDAKFIVADFRNPAAPIGRSVKPTLVQQVQK